MKKTPRITTRLTGIRHGQVRVWRAGQWWDLVYGPADQRIDQETGEVSGTYVIARATDQDRHRDCRREFYAECFCPTCRAETRARLT